MKKQVIVIHGGDTFNAYEKYIEFLKNWQIDFEAYRTGKSDWKRGLEEKLGAGYEVIRPDMPAKLNAKYTEWQIWFEKFIPFFENEAVFVGHSLGGLFLAKYLSENNLPKKIKAAFLIAAPYDEKDLKGESLADFILSENLNKFQNQCEKIFIYHSEDDPCVPLAEFEKYKKALPGAVTKTFEKKGHFNQEELPELILDIKSLYLT